jgi:hypothetical protein
MVLMEILIVDDFHLLWSRLRIFDSAKALLKLAMA